MTSSSWACLRVVGDVDDEWRQRSLWAAGATGQSSLPACGARACVWNTTSDAAAVDENYRCHHISFWCLVPAASAMAVYTYIQFSIHVNGFHGISFRYWHLLLIFSIQGAWSKSKPFWGYRASYAGLVRYILLPCVCPSDKISVFIKRLNVGSCKQRHRILAQLAMHVVRVTWPISTFCGPQAMSGADEARYFKFGLQIERKEYYHYNCQNSAISGCIRGRVTS